MPPKPQGLPKLTGLPKPLDLNVDVHVEVGGAALPNVERDGVRCIAVLPGKTFEIAIAGSLCSQPNASSTGGPCSALARLTGGVACHANGPAGGE